MCSCVWQAALELREEELARAGAWLDLVVALLTLRRAEPCHLLSTLQPDFIDRLLAVGGEPHSVYTVLYSPLYVYSTLHLLSAHM